MAAMDAKVIALSLSKNRGAVSLVAFLVCLSVPA